LPLRAQGRHHRADELLLQIRLQKLEGGPRRIGKDRDVLLEVATQLPADEIENFSSLSLG
jgi:hypothetical protein